MEIDAMHNLNIAALEETLKAAEYLLPVHDLIGTQPVFYTEQSRLGFPCALLLSCFIEALGHRVLNRQNKKAFEILKHPDWYNISSLSTKHCESIYDIYRCKLCHNLILPKGFQIDANPENPVIFNFNTSGKDVISVNLYALLEQSKKMLEKFKVSKDTELSSYIKNLDNLSAHINFDRPINDTCLSPSGIQSYD